MNRRINQKKIAFLATLLWVSLTLPCCNRYDHRGIERTPPWFHQYAFYNAEDYSSALLEKVQNLSSTHALFVEDVQQFYQSLGGPYWTENGFQEHKIASFMDALALSYEDGLPPASLGYDTLVSLINKVRDGKFDSPETLYGAMTRLELVLTNAYLHYAKSLAYGATDPQIIHGSKWHYEMAPFSAQFAETALASIDTAARYLQSLQPADSNYVALKSELKKYLLLKDTVFKKIPYIEATKGAYVKNVHLIGERLALLQEIDSQYHPSDTLTAQLMSAINHFRINRAIPISNQLDAETIDALNWQPQEYINKLIANMDRYRWRVAPPKGERFIAVNIPDYTLQAWNADTLALKMRVCCGKYKSYDKPIDSYKKNGVLPPQESETPLLYSEINYVSLNPEWKIPPKIIRDEYYGKMVRNSQQVVEKEKLYIIDGRTHQRVEPQTINWKNVNQKNIPYQLIQSSGAHNALGLIKFNFPNSESVYLHDTNNKGAFKRRTRALSHGCVRVENPVELAVLLFQINEYEEEDLEQVMIILGQEPETEKGEEFWKQMQEKEKKYFEGLGGDTLFYRPLRPTNKMLKKRMPVYIEYYTCFVNENGEVQYRPDIYQKEGNVLAGLEHLLSL